MIDEDPRSAPNADEPCTLTLTRAEAGMVRVVLGTHRHTIARKQRNVESKRERLGDEFVAERTAHNDRDLALTNSAYRKVKRALWGKDDD